MVQVKMVMALTATLSGVYTTDVNVNNVIAQSIAGVNAPPAPVQAVANPTLNNPSVSAPAISTTGSAIPGVCSLRTPTDHLRWVHTETTSESNMTCLSWRDCVPGARMLSAEPALQCLGCNKLQHIWSTSQGQLP